MNSTWCRNAVNEKDIAYTELGNSPVHASQRPIGLPSDPEMALAVLPSQYERRGKVPSPIREKVVIVKVGHDYPTALDVVGADRGTWWPVVVRFLRDDVHVIAVAIISPEFAAKFFIAKRAE